MLKMLKLYIYFKPQWRQNVQEIAHILTVMYSTTMCRFFNQQQAKINIPVVLIAENIHLPRIYLKNLILKA